LLFAACTFADKDIHLTTGHQVNSLRTEKTLEQKAIVMV
jgi:hypothetical protein